MQRPRTLGGSFVLLGALLSAPVEATNPTDSFSLSFESQQQSAAAQGGQNQRRRGRRRAPDPVHRDAIAEGLASSATWRQIGPANMGGRITDLAVVESNPSTFFVATAGGGLWKTQNDGITFTQHFTDQSTVSIGDVCVDPNDPNTVWVGSGEENGRNSVSWGDGVYKSTDGGASFEHMGLEETFQIGHIEVDPRNSNTVFVAALGRLWGPNNARGVFRTKDGGTTWEKVLYIDEDTGCMDVRVDPSNPDIVYAAMYVRRRDGFDSNDPAVRFGEQSGLYKSTDGGDTWKELTNGLPSCNWGRSGLSIYQKNPSTLFLIVETERSGWATGTERTAQREGGDAAYMGIQGEDADKDQGARLTTITPNGPSQKAGVQTGDIVTKVGDKKVTSYQGLVSIIRSSKGGDKTTLEVLRGGEKKTLDITWGSRSQLGGGQNRNRTPYAGRLGGQVPNVQERQGDQGFETGGIFRSDDRGETWTRINSLTDRPFYYSVIAVDPSDDSNIYSAGVPLYGSFDGGKSFEQVHRGIHVDFHAIWVDPNDSDHVMAGCDGGLHISYDRTKTWKQVNNFPIGQFYHADVDQADPYNVYGGLQDNGTWGGPHTTRWREGAILHDWVTIYGGDGFRAKIDPMDPDTVYATSQNGGIGRVNMKTASTGRVSKPRGRWNWDTPFFLSPHNHHTLYFAGSVAARSVDQGRNSEALSPTLGLTERGTATAFAESPVERGVLYVGTDDGALWRSNDGGTNWEQIQDNVAELKGPRYVSSIEPSNFDADRVYVTFEGHRSDDFTTYVFVSEDRGDTWKDLTDKLPANSPAHIVKEDTRNADLLFVGTEFGCHVSLDRGATWNEFGDLPTVAVRDLALQDRENDLVAATHGGGIYVADITALREARGNVLAASTHLFAPERDTAWTMRSRVLNGHSMWRANNERMRADIVLWLAEAPSKDAKIEVMDIRGEVLATMKAPQEAGLHAMAWDGRIGRGRRARRATPGTYAIRYSDGDTTQTVTWTLRPDPDGTMTPISSPMPTGTTRD